MVSYLTNLTNFRGKNQVIQLTLRRRKKDYGKFSAFGATFDRKRKTYKSIQKDGEC